ncbi:GntR family transcriptional regulator [Bradyrhizobium sp. USDA 4502]
MHTLKVVDRTYLKLKSMVINYEILPEQQIFIEGVSNTLNVSVTPVREALNRLLHEGLILQTGSRGFQNRAIDRAELEDLLFLRGSLAISSLHFMLRTALRHRVDEIVAESRRINVTDASLCIPVCRLVLQAVGNREILRIYQNVTDKLHYIWMVYASSASGAAQIKDYVSRLEQLLLDRDLEGALGVVDQNVRVQTKALDDVIPQALARLNSASAEARDRAPGNRLSRLGSSWFPSQPLARGQT